MATLLNVDPEDVGAVAMAAMAWVMGLPLAANDEENVRRLASQIEDVLSNLTDESTGRPVALKEGWWRR
jgi:hypothetical protein